MKREIQHIWVGVTVFVIGALIIASVSMSGRPGETTGLDYEITARFRSIDGISVGSDVTLAGIHVGTVTKQVFDPADLSAVITMSIDNYIKIPYDSVAMIVSTGVLGRNFIKIAAGGQEDYFEAGDEFEYIQNSIIFEELLEKVILSAEAKRKKKATAE
jgi:phospholipid/cholesterol/gamma-HCH transport system substrate-binding protein